MPQINRRRVRINHISRIGTLLASVSHVTSNKSSFQLTVNRCKSKGAFFLLLIHSVTVRQGLIAIRTSLSPSQHLRTAKKRTQSLCTRLVQGVSAHSGPSNKTVNDIIRHFIAATLARTHSANTSPRRIVQRGLTRLSRVANNCSFTRIVTTC